MQQHRYPAATLRAAAQNIADHYHDVGYAAEKCSVSRSTMYRLLDPDTETVSGTTATRVAEATGTPLPPPLPKPVKHKPEPAPRKPRISSRQRVADQVVDIIEATGGVRQAADRTGMTPAQLGTIANHMDQRVPRQLSDHIRSCHQQVTNRQDVA